MSNGRYKVSLVVILTVFWAGQGCVGIPPTAAPTAEIALPTSTSTTALTATVIPPSPTLTPTPEEEQKSELDLSQMNVDEWASTSSDGTWVATGLVAFPKENIGGQLAYVRLMIFSADGRTNWTIIDEMQEIGLGFPMPAPVKWSQVGKHFYFTYRVIPDGCSAFDVRSGLQQVNLEDGSVTELLPHISLALALKPDESQVAFVRSGERRLVVRDLTTGEERETQIDPGKNFNAGNLLWSPDGKSLALTLAINPCEGAFGVSRTVWAESTSILWVDAETLEQKVLLQEDSRLFVTFEWNEPGRITLVDGQESSLWELNVNSGEIIRK